MSGQTCRRQLSTVCRFTTLLTIEPFFFVFFILNNIKNTPTSQLVQDKICLHHFHLNASYCHALPQMTASDDYLGKKSDILSEANNYSIYSALFQTLPGFVAGFLIGPWTDKYVKAKKIVIMAGALAGICEAIILILNVCFYDWSPYAVIASYLPTTFTGGMLALFTSVYAYVAATTPAKYRAYRMGILEVLSGIASPLATYLSGMLLNTKPWLSDGQLYDFLSIYVILVIGHTLNLIWIIFMLNEEKDTLNFAKFDGIDSEKLTVPGCVRLKHFEPYRETHPLKLLFNINNIKEMLKACFKKRPGNVRLQLWLQFVVTMCYLISHMGPPMFLYTFVQKVYSWDSETYSNVSAINNLINALATLICAPILIKVFNMRDTTLVIVGSISYFIQNIIRGTVLTAQGFYISIAPGCLGALAAIGMKTYISKLVTVKEQGKVFSLLSSVDSLMPLVAAGFFTQVFNATMDTMPGLSFILNALLLFFPVGINVWIHFWAKLPDTEEEVISINHGDAEDNDTGITKC